MLFAQFFNLSKDRFCLEKKYNIFAPYKENHELKNYWDKITKKCRSLKKLNLKNKVLINKKIYLNQRFLELFLSDKKCITYNISGNLET